MGPYRDGLGGLLGSSDREEGTCGHSSQGAVQLRNAPVVHSTTCQGTTGGTLIRDLGGYLGAI